MTSRLVRIVASSMLLCALIGAGLLAPLGTRRASASTGAVPPDSVVGFGSAAGQGGQGPNGPVVAIAARPGGGYWTVTSSGVVTAGQGAPSYGDLSGDTLNAPVVGMAATPDGRGYWLVASDGGVFSFGDAGFYGSTGGMRLDKPVVGMAATADGRGYWLVASDGGVFSFGDAGFHGSETQASLTAPAVGMAAAPGGGGYLVAYGSTAPASSALGQEQLLAGLGYLPLTWNSLGFQWRWADNPPQLTALWTPGSYNTILEGAIDAFEHHAGLTMDGRIGSAETTALLAAATNPSANMNPDGYSYALAQEFAGTPTPESLTVWHDGTVVEATPANTGIAASPTVIGTFPVYLRYRNQVMTGTDPNGQHYADPVQFVAYFYGGDAIHYMPRASYGYPQSLGCVEIPYGPASVIWNYTTYGTLVTVTTG